MPLYLHAMLETIGTRSSRLGQPGPPIARGSMNNTFSPTMPASRLLLEFERLLDVHLRSQAVPQTLHGSARAALNEWSPVADIRETPEALTFAVELPGIAPDHVQVTLEERMLTVRGIRSPTHVGTLDEGEHLIERHGGAFVRRFQLPAPLDASMITAEYANGLLELRVPKAARPQPTVIPVKSADHVAPTPRVMPRGDVRASLKGGPVANGSGKTVRTGISS